MMLDGVMTNLRPGQSSQSSQSLITELSAQNMELKLDPQNMRTGRFVLFTSSGNRLDRHKCVLSACGDDADGYQPDGNRRCERGIHSSGGWHM